MDGYTSLKSTETRDKPSTTCSLNKSYVKMPVSTWCYIPISLPPEPYVKIPVAPDGTSLHHCLKNKQLKLICFQW